MLKAEGMRVRSSLKLREDNLMHRSHPCSCSCWVPVKIAACQVKVLYIALTFSSCFRAHLTAYVILFRHSVLLKDTHTLFQHLYMFPIIVKLLFSTIGLSLLDCHYCYSASTSTFRSTLKIENKNSRNPTILCHLSKARHPSIVYIYTRPMHPSILDCLSNYGVEFIWKCGLHVYHHGQVTNA